MSGSPEIASRKPGPAPTLSVTDLRKHFRRRTGFLSRDPGIVYAVDSVSLTVGHGETLGLVGESGCGKSTVGRSILRLIEPSSGTIRLLDQDITHVGAGELRRLRRHMQMIFQDPFSSLNPRLSAGEIVAEPIATHGIASGQEKWERVASLFERVGLRPDQMSDFPSQFSGGQRQRIGIARALAAGPSLIIGDEPVSALDVSIQAQVLNLLMDLQDQDKISYLFIAHDLAVVRHISHRIAVMYLGRIVELASKEALFASPQHPYTEALLSAVPVPKAKARRRKKIILEGEIPSPMHPPSGCRFHTRCPYAQAICKSTPPELREIAPSHWVSCHFR
jgi:peptide/nickel transport system ATP-binding protein/oligopeptide transport system ATP-binding protein